MSNSGDKRPKPDFVRLREIKQGNCMIYDFTDPFFMVGLTKEKRAFSGG